MKKGLKANEWVTQVQQLICGRGGGKDISAQATGSNVDSIDAAMKQATDFACAKLGIVQESPKPSKEEKSSGATNNQVNIERLNEHLSNSSYVTGFELSVDDVTLFEALAGADVSRFVHVARWRRHVASFEGEQLKALGGTKRSVAEWGFAKASEGGDASDDDDMDLFGDDDEEDEEAKQIKEVFTIFHHLVVSDR